LGVALNAKQILRAEVGNLDLYLIGCVRESADRDRISRPRLFDRRMIISMASALYAMNS
jgi:hypothetical protein